MTRSSRILNVLAVFLYIGCVVKFVEAEIAEKYTQNPCVNKQTCHACIQTESCAWCIQPDFGDRPRCFQPSYATLGACSEEYTWNPENNQNLILNRELTRGGQIARSSYSASDSNFQSSRGSSRNFGTAEEEIVQISPQMINLKLRTNQGHRVQFQYSQAEDYPVDIYYLMDLSKSMEEDKAKLSKLGDLLSDTMRNITSNIRLGFGSFVDKVSTNPKKSEHPCEDCEAPYDFRNHMSLSKDTGKFSEEVKRATLSRNLSGNISRNLDVSESGLDAIVQAIVCGDQIGWRSQARRLLIFSTNAGFQYAGRGRHGGVKQPNDGECHLDSKGSYIHSTTQDYPTISQVNHHVMENFVNIIFAVTPEQINPYRKLSEHIEGSSVAILASDSSNVVDLVREEYSKISLSIEMKDNASSAVKITYHSACLSGRSPIPTARCDYLKVGDIVSFTAEIVLTSCPSDPKDWHQLIQIYPVGINQSLVINLEMVCSCPCEHPGHPTFEGLPSPKCHFHGQNICGICQCDEGYFGRNCECATAYFNAGNEALGCRVDNKTEIDCSGRGSCLCGICECEKRYNPAEMIYGKFCECDNFSCDRHNQLLCSGPDHGSCECGTCTCKPGWSGSACDCRSSIDTCIPPNGGEICSGHGDCECGACRCKATEEGRYSGKYCEKCPTCKTS